VISSKMDKMTENVKNASFILQALSTNDKNSILQAIHQKLVENKEKVLAENKKDLQLSSEAVSPQLYKRLDISNKFDSLLEGVLDVQNLPDPNDKVLMGTRLDDNLELFKVACPVGVLLIIFEARPEVVVQISCLAIKSGNAVILKGGKEANNSNRCLFEIVQSAIESVHPELKDCVQLVTQREDIASLLKLDDYIDLVIPRGICTLKL
jgi:glutamate-5-semialdehyde dehydrogenase